MQFSLGLGDCSDYVVETRYARVWHLCNETNDVYLMNTFRKMRPINLVLTESRRNVLPSEILELIMA